MQVLESYIGFGDAAIYTTIGRMKAIINASSKNPYIREWARKIVGNVQVNNRFKEAEAVYNFVRDNVRYTRDPYGYEYIQTPPVLLEGIKQYLKGEAERPIGDCDDMTVLSLSLLKSIGFPVAIKVVSFNENKKYGHVYGLVNVDGRWVPIDCVRPDKSFGWESTGHTRIMEVII